MAGPGQQDGAATRPRRNQLPRIGAPRRPQGAHHRRRFRHGPRRRHRLCARRRGRRHQLLSQRRTRRQGSHRPDQGRGTRSAWRSPAICATRRSARNWSTRRSEASAGSISSSATPAGSRRTPPSSTSRPRISTATMKTNIYAPFWIIKAALPHLQARLGHHRHGLGAGLRSFARSVRLRADQSRDDELREVARQTARAERHPRQWRGARTDLDAAAGQRRRDPGKAEEVRRQTPLGRPGQPAELGSIYVQLAAADASYATGQVYGSAGGSGQP